MPGGEGDQVGDETKYSRGHPEKVNVFFTRRPNGCWAPSGIVGRRRGGVTAVLSGQVGRGRGNSEARVGSNGSAVSTDISLRVLLAQQLQSQDR
ncbi:hypothetical protein EYF80_044257 [Liparis tanakae]|uniref:Uncharacterized protein n=1 Tax=Liparis tanakae TaxID=230148 RepID=A0A4Z2FX55_9TELE|nr:hypothetical protein EYF80_044257 [Liparis tanakae]